MIESKIGEFQLKIMKDFPEALLLFKRQVMFGSVMEGDKIPEKVDENELSKKIWQFKSPDEVVVNVSSESLDIVTHSHKTYNNKGSSNKFRDVIQRVVSAFFEITNIPIITRMGLRYIDECPVFPPKKINFPKSYNTSFNLSKFDLDETLLMDLTTLQKRGDYILRYKETLKPNPNGSFSLTLDFDGSANNVISKQYLLTLDKIHAVIADEFEKTVKKPVIDFMKKIPKNGQ
jgi:uncharacterized protein (TIGR04255 family)